MTGRFKPRPTRFVEISVINGWRLKRYQIAVDSAPISDMVTDAVDAVLVKHLPQSTVGDVTVGFLIVHHGAESIWVLADLWMGDIVHQHTFSAPLDDPENLESVQAGGPTACVWELPIHAFERDSFVKHVLDPQDGPDTDAYRKSFPD